MVQSGDLAPKLTFTKIMAPAGAIDWKYENFLGQVTLLVFFPNVSDATAAFASQWNESIGSFASRPVQFVLIARDEEWQLQRWLGDHPLRGWVILDSSWETAQAWGVQQPQTVFIDRDARVVGFYPGILPNGSNVEEILMGRANMTRLRARPLPEGNKPDVSASDVVHISPTKMALEHGTSESSGPDHWSALGFELKAIIAKVYEIDETRIDFPAALDNGERYDFELLLAREEDNALKIRLFRDAIERYFGLIIMPEVRHVDVYVMTAPKGAGPGLSEAEFGMSLSTSSSYPIFWNSPHGGPPTMADVFKAKPPVQDISGSSTTITTLCSILERGLDRLVVDETGLTGNYDFQIISSEGDRDLFQILRDELGLIATPSQRDITILSVRQP